MVNSNVPPSKARVEDVELALEAGEVPEAQNSVSSAYVAAKRPSSSATGISAVYNV